MLMANGYLYFPPPWRPSLHPIPFIPSYPSIRPTDHPSVHLNCHSFLYFFLSFFVVLFFLFLCFFFALVSLCFRCLHITKLVHPIFSLWVHLHSHPLYVPLFHALLAHLHGVCPLLTRFLFLLLIITVVFSFFQSFPYLSSFHPFQSLFFLLCLPTVCPLVCLSV